MDGKFSREGLQSLDEDDDMLTAMAYELVFCVRSLHTAKLSDRSKSIRRMIRQFRRSREASSEIIQTNQEKACVRQPSLANCSYRDGQRVEISRTDLQPRGHRIDPTVDRRES